MTIRSKAELTALYANNTSGDISPADLRDLVDSINPGWGGYYISAAAPTTSLPFSTYVKASGTTIATSLSNFSHSNNRLTYDGVPNVHVHIAASVSFTSSSDNDIIGVALAINGSTLPGPILRKVGAGGDIGSSAVHGDAMLSTGDTIELFVSTNDVGGPSITIDSGYVWVMAMLV